MYQFLKTHNTIPSDLPFCRIKSEFISAVKNDNNKIVVVRAETGSGKTVMSSIALAESMFTCMLTVPLTVATTAMYKFISENARIQSDVGYACKGDVHYSDHSKVKIVTTKHGFNCIKRVLANDKKFREGKTYKGIRKFDDNFVFVLDEAHHTTQENMGTFKLAKKAIERGLLKKLVVMSATLGFMDFSGFQTEFLVAEGRSFDIAKTFASTNVDFRDPRHFTSRIVEYFDEIHNGTDNVLIFVPGSSDVDTLVAQFDDKQNNNWCVYGLHGQMDKDEADEAVLPVENGKVKIVISTDVAESSITIPDIDTVIVSCVHKSLQASSNGSGTTLITKYAPRNRLIQQIGRCGRTKVGKAFIMVTESTWNGLDTHDPSDMEKLFPYEMVIELLAEDLDAQDLLDIHYSRYQVIVKKLQSLDLITDRLKVTDMGIGVSRFPYSIENAVVAYKLQHLARYEVNDKLILFTAICMASFEGSGGNSLFFVPKAERRSKQQFIEMQFGHLKGSTDFETYINIFFEMVEYAENYKKNNSKHVDKILAEYAKTHFMNNKILKKIRKCFIKLVNIIYDTDYNSKSFVKCVNDFGEINNSSRIMNNVYRIFSESHSDKIFFDAQQDKKGNTTYAKANELVSARYSIDNIRSFSFSPSHERFVALQVVEIRGQINRNCISGIFPLVT